jgi:hypothetical protein
MAWFNSYSQLTFRLCVIVLWQECVALKIVPLSCSPSFALMAVTSRAEKILWQVIHDFAINVPRRPVVSRPFYSTRNQYMAKLTLFSCNLFKTKELYVFYSVIFTMKSMCLFLGYTFLHRGTYFGKHLHDARGIPRGMGRYYTIETHLKCWKPHNYSFLLTSREI